MASSTYRYFFLCFALGEGAASSSCEYQHGLMSDTCSDEGTLFLQNAGTIAVHKPPLRDAPEGNRGQAAVGAIDMLNEIFWNKFHHNYKVKTLLHVVDRVEEELQSLRANDTMHDVYGALPEPSQDSMQDAMPPVFRGQEAIDANTGNLENSTDAQKALSALEDAVDQLLFGAFKSTDNISTVRKVFGEAKALLGQLDPDSKLLEARRAIDAIKARESLLMTGVSKTRSIVNESLRRECCKIAAKYGVRSSVTFGSAPYNDRVFWNQNSCDKEVGGSSCKAYYEENAFKNGLLVLVRAGGRMSAARLRAGNETWARGSMHGPQSKVVTFFDNPDISKRCAMQFGDNHGAGLTCEEAHNELRVLNRSDFQWLLVVDDDAYVHIPNMEKTVGRLDPTAQTVWGVHGCGTCLRGRMSLCGGGGYLISRKNLEDMAFQEDLWLDEFLHTPDKDWCDVRFGCVAQRHGLKLERLPGLYPWSDAFTPEQEQEVMYSSQVPVLVVHYSEPPKMHQYYKMEAETAIHRGEHQKPASYFNSEYLVRGFKGTNLLKTKKGTSLLQEEAKSGMTLAKYWSQHDEHVKQQREHPVSK